MKHFLIYTNAHKDQGLETTSRIRSYLEGRGQRVSLRVKETDWKEKPGQEEGDVSDIPGDIDCMLVLGGDGTVLQAARETKGLQVPLIGVNLGTLGYMTEIEPAGLEEALERLLQGDYVCQKRMMLKGKTYHSSGVCEEDWALNDIVLSRSGPLQIMRYNIYVNGQFLHDYAADGIIVTTPTGSTGYNLSAGGPLVEPGARLMVLTPICPHSLNQRSIVLSAQDVIEIDIPEGKEGKIQVAKAHFDGCHQIELKTGDSIRIVQSEEAAEFIRLNQVSFLEVLHKKMRQAM